MLKEKHIEHTYREYRKDPLSRDELDALMQQLGMGPKDVLRKRDKAYKELGLTGQESDDALLDHMAEHPTLLQRPIAVMGDRAVVGRPVEAMLELVSDT